MARGMSPKTLAGMIQRLQIERQKYQQKVEEIDAIFAECGIAPAATPARRGPGRPAKSVDAPAAAPAKAGRRVRRRRRKFGSSGTQSILDFLKAAGRGGAGSSEISKHWKSQGRSGEPYVTLGQLNKAGKIKKKDIKGQRGSQYWLA